MKDFTETLKTANKELLWLVNKAVVVKEYAECVEKKFSGRLAYAFAMKVLSKNAWDKFSENGKSGSAHLWFAQSMNAGVTFSAKTLQIEFTFYEAK